MNHDTTANKPDRLNTSGSEGGCSLAQEIPASSPASAVPQNNYQLRVFQSLRRIIRAIELHSRKLDTVHHITGPQHVCLLALKEEAPLTVKRLAQLACLSPSTIVGIVDRLEEKGLAQRIRSTSDRRAVMITVTEKGQKLLASTPSPIQASLARALENLPESEKTSIALAFEKVVELMEAGDLEVTAALEFDFQTDRLKNTR